MTPSQEAALTCATGYSAETGSANAKRDMNKSRRTLLESIYRLYEHSGFAMAGAVAFSFVVSLFPFCIFLGAISGVVGGRDLAAKAVAQLFQILPAPSPRRWRPRSTPSWARAASTC